MQLGNMYGLRRCLPRRGMPGVVGLGISATVVVLLANIGLLIYAVCQPSSQLGTRILYQGDCGYVASRSTVAHLAINILGTLVLAASNAAMQCLSAPTRENVDRAHARGSWLDIGIGGVRNLWQIGIRRQMLWGLLLVSSLPLHLLYNSVFIQSTSASEYYAILVTQDFLAGAPFNNDTYQGIAAAHNASNPDRIEHIRMQAPTFSQLSYEVCLDTYDTPFVEGRTNVVLLTNITSYESSQANSSVLLSTFFSPFVQSLNYSLFYATEQQQSEDDIYQFEPYLINGTLPYMITPTGSIEPNSYATAKIESCLSQEVDAACRIEFYVPFMVVVIICNVLKLACFIFMIRGFSSLRTLVTIGDALASFLTRPDPYTEGGRAVQREDFEGYFQQQVQAEMRVRGGLMHSRIAWKGVRYGRSRGVGGFQGLLTFVACAAWVLGGAIIIGLIATPNPDAGYTPVSLAKLWSNGFGHPYPQEIVGSTVSQGLAANILLANVPQLVISAFYLAYNQDLTTLCISAEMSAFSNERKYLRVTSPTGKQRSTYWLGLPYRYSIPLLASAAAMHWAASQGVFLTEISVVNTEGQVNEDQHINAVGYSLIGLLIMYIIGWILIICLIVTRVWRLSAGIPVMGSCSLAISAACHGSESHRVNVEKPLQYGVTQVTSERCARVGFSDEEVELLQRGWDYNGLRPPKAVTETIK